MTNISADIDRMIAEADTQLDKEIVRKHDIGDEKYGHRTYLQNPTLEMAMDEVVDMINYMKYTYQKLYIMNKVLTASQEQPAQQSLLSGSFVPTSKLFGEE